MTDRVPPHDNNAEQSVLGCCLIDQEAAAEICATLKPGDFYQGAHKAIFKGIKDLISEQKPADLVTVNSYLQQTKELDSIGGASYLGSLAHTVPTAVHAEFYCDIVKRLSQVRHILKTGTDVAAEGYKVNSDKAEEYRAWAESKLFRAISNYEEAGGFKSARDIITGGVLEEMIEGVDTSKTIRMPWNNVSKLVSNLFPGDLVIIAARPSMGKSALLGQICDHVAAKYGPVTVHLMESSKEAYMKRAISREARVNSHFGRFGALKDDEAAEVTKQAKKLAKLPLFLDDTANVTVSYVASKARRVKAKHGLKLIGVDYLQLMQGTGENRTQEVAGLSRGLKGIAKDLQVPVIALCQLSRACEQRQNKRPMLSDLRESGNLEQDADVIMFIYRDDYYNAESDKKGIAEIIVAKQREGPVGYAELGWIKEYTKFVDLERREF